MAGGGLFGPEQLVAFELSDAGLVGTDDGGAVGRDDAVEQLLDLALDLGGFTVGAGGEVAADGLAVVGAALGETEIVWVLVAGLRGRPAGDQRPTTAGAGDGTAQGENCVDIGQGRDTRALGNAGLDALILSKGDQALVMALAARNTQVGHLDIAGIVEPSEKPVHLLKADLAARITAGQGGLGFEEALDLGLALQPAGGKAFEGVGEDGGDGLVADHDLAMAGAALEAIARRRVEAPIAVEGARPHPVLGLLAVLLALMLT
ncbi:MAG: hypothetical protein AAF577_07210 [Pseudomonadota bacterium]